MEDVGGGGGGGGVKPKNVGQMVRKTKRGRHSIMHSCAVVPQVFGLIPYVYCACLTLTLLKYLGAVYTSVKNMVHCVHVHTYRMLCSFYWATELALWK